jgi:hypothetical protein
LHCTECYSKGTTIKLEGGGYGFFLKKYSDFQCCWKKYLTSEHGNVNLDPVGQAQKMAGLINLPSVVSIQMNYRNIQHKKKIKVYMFLNEWVNMYLVSVRKDEV